MIVAIAIFGALLLVVAILALGACVCGASIVEADEP